MTIINSALNNILNSASNLKNAIDDAGVLDAKKAAAAPTPTSTTNTSNVSASDTLNYLANNANALTVGNVLLKPTAAQTAEAKLKVAELKALGITLNTSDVATINKITIGINLINGAVTLSGVNGTSTNPITVTRSNVKGINSVNITGSSNVTVAADAATANTTTIARDCTNVLTSTQRTANAKTADLAAMGITLNTTDAAAISKITYSKDANGVVTLTGISGTTTNPFSLTINKAKGINAVNIASSQNVNVVYDTSCKVTTSGSTNVALTTKGQQIKKDLATMGVTVNTNDESILSNITYSRDARRVLTISGINGTSTQPVLVDVTKTPNVVNVAFANSSNVIFNPDKTAVNSTFAGNNCTNVNSISQVVSQKVSALASMGIYVTGPDQMSIVNMNYSKDTKTGIVTLSNVVGTTSTLFDVNTTNLKGINGVNIVSSSNVTMTTGTKNNTTIGANCVNVETSTQRAADKTISDLKSYGITLNTTDVTTINRISYSKDSTTGIVTISNLVGSDTNLINLNAVSTNGIKGVNITNSINATIFTDAATVNTTKIGANCGNVEFSAQRAAENSAANAASNAAAKISQLKGYGITLSTSDVTAINNLTVSKDAATGIVTLSGINGTSTTPITVNVANNAKVNIANSNNALVITASGSSATQNAGNCKNVTIETTSQKKKSDLEAYGVVVDAAATDDAYWNSINYTLSGKLLKITGANGTTASPKTITIGSNATIDSISFDDKDTNNIKLNVNNTVNTQFQVYITGNSAENVSVTYAKDTTTPWVWTYEGSFTPYAPNNYIVTPATMTINSFNVANKTASFATKTKVYALANSLTLTNGVYAGQ